MELHLQAFKSIRSFTIEEWLCKWQLKKWATFESLFSFVLKHSIHN